MAEWMPVLVAQAWQVTLLIVVVATINRWLAKSRPHLAHALWLVVLVKCVTPPVWSSPSGLFCWLQPARETMREPLVFEPPSRDWDELNVVAHQSQYKFVVRRGNVLVESNVEPEESLIGFGEISNPVAELSSPITTDKVDWPSMLFGAWALVSLVVIAVAVVRWLRCWRVLRNAPQRECSELSEQLDSLAKQLRLRRRVRLIVTESRLGPAVIGLFRATVLLPALIVDRLAQRSPVAPRQESRASCDSNSLRGFEDRPHDGISVAEQQSYDSPLAPILAHELLHIRRGDLWVGLLQTLAQAVWWCHPLVWWVNRRTTREAERCCDEEVLAELGCDPAAYARALVDVLELKRELKPVPVFPGVRPVEVTSQRLERIMQLGQGCQRRTPWWCWLIAALAAAATWPGAAFVVTAEDAKEAGERGGVSPPVISSQPPDRGADATQLAITSDGAIDLDNEPKLGLAYRVRVMSGAANDLRPLAQKLNDKLIAKPGAPVVVEHDELLRLLKDAQAFPRLKLTSHPVATGRGNKEVSIGDTATFAVPVESTAADGTTTLLEQSCEYGWRLTMQPLSVGIESLRLRVVNELSRLNNDAAVKVHYQTTGEEKLIPGLDVQRTNTTVELKHAQHVVFPITKMPNADSQDVMLVMMQACLVVLDEAPQQPEPTPMNVPGSSIRRGVGVNSDAGITGEVVPVEDQFASNGNIREVRVEGNRLVPTDELLAQIKSKAGQPIQSEQIRDDVRRLYATRRFFSVEPRLEKTDEGSVVVFRVLERPVIERVEFRGAKRIAANELQELTAIREGGVFNPSVNREAAKRIEEYYRAHGFLSVRVKLAKGSERQDRQVIFEIDEDPRRIFGDAKFAGNLQLDSLGQLVWQHGSWFVVVRPEPGRKLIDSGKSPSQFHSDGPTRIMLTKVVRGTSHKTQLAITGDEWRLTSEETGLKMQMSGDVRLSGQDFAAKSDSMALTLPFLPTDDSGALDLTLWLRGHASIWQNYSREQNELSADNVILYMKGAALSRLEVSANGFVGILREPPNRDHAVIRFGLTELAMAKSEKRVTFNFEKIPLVEAVKQLAQSIGRNIVLEKPGLEDESLTERVPVTLSVDDVKLSSALKLLLDPLNLGYRIDESGVIVVTSQRRLRGQSVVITYSVADLAIPAPKRVAVKLAADRSAAGNEFKPSNPTTPMPSQIPELIKLITSTCQPNSWKGVGGNGQIKANDSTLSLVVWQTRDVHDEIRDLLEQMRRLHDLQAALQVETLTVPADFWQQVGRDFDAVEADGQSTLEQLQHNPVPRSVARLTKKEAALLRSLVRPESTPKVTLFNGQELELFFGGESPTMRLALKPSVSADRKGLRLQATATKPDAELDFAKLAPIALETGHSLLLDVTEVYSVGATSGVPTLNKGPGEARLFKNTGKSDQRTLLLITGQVVIVEDEVVRRGIPK